MSEEQLQTCTYRILRYTPNLVRDEWINIGVLLHEPARNALRVRLIEEDDAFARLRKLRFDANESLLRALQSDLEAQAAAHKDGPAGLLRHLGALPELRGRLVLADLHRRETVWPHDGWRRERRVVARLPQLPRHQPAH